MYRVCTEDGHILNYYHSRKEACAYREACNTFVRNNPKMCDQKWDITHVERWNDDLGIWKRS